MLLDDLLAAIDLDVAPFAVCEIRRGWSVDMPPDGHTVLHFVVTGEGTVRIGSEPPRPFPSNAVMVIPPGRPHRVDVSSPVAGTVDAAADCSLPEHGLRRLVAGAGESGAILVCGSVRATYAGAFGVFDGLTEPLVVDFGDDPRMRALFEALLAEQRSFGPGSLAMMRALMMQGIVAILRRLCDRGDCRVPWLATLDDPALARVIEVMLARPADPHSLESMAKLAGMSRSSFAERFTRTFGRPAMDFLRETRLRRGAELLRATDLPVETVAHRIGFQSRSHFSRAFTSQYGLDPTSFRTSG